MPEKSFWEHRWNEGSTGWHINQVHPYLQQYHSLLKKSSPASLLVPLCGKSHDLVWLLQKGFSVTGIEYVQKASEQFFSQVLNVEIPKSLLKNKMIHYQYKSLHYVVGDFFNFISDTLFDFIYDRAALIAIEPSLREKYVQKQSTLLKDNGKIFLITFECDYGIGPPFSVSIEDIIKLYQPFFTIQVVEKKDIFHEPDSQRFINQGASYLVEAVILLSKK